VRPPEQRTACRLPREGEGSRARAERDPANPLWQRDLIVSYVKLSEVSGDKSCVRKALGIAREIQRRGTLAPRDAWIIDELKRRSGA
jgi:hypothetical protein